MKTKLKLLHRPKLESPDLDGLSIMPRHELQQLHRELFGSAAHAGNVEQARRRIAWRLQADREGGLPESARQHALALARESAARVRLGVARHDPIQHAAVTDLVSDHDSRIPMPGSVIVKDYRGRTLLVRVLAAGFELDGRRFASLSAVAKEITGTKWNGLAFFGLARGRANGR